MSKRNRFSIKSFENEIITLLVSNNNVDKSIIIKIMELNYVIPGHYVKKETLGSDGENVEMIRVLKADPDNEGYWFIQDNSKVKTNKRIHESILLNEYEILKVDTPQHYKTTKNLLGDISNMKQPKQENLIQAEKKILSDIVEEQKESLKVYESFNDKIIQVTAKENSKEVFKETPKYSFDINIVNKCNIENINKESREKFGEQYIEINDEPINFNLQLKLGYDISKLKQLVELLNLNVEEISQFLAEQIISRIDLKKLISNRVFDMLNGNLEPSKIAKTIIEKETQEQTQESIQETKEETFHKNIETPIKRTGLPNERELEILAKMRKSNTQTNQSNQTNNSNSNETKIQQGLKDIDKLLENFM